MFDIGFLELIFIALIALLVLGPERMPEAIRTTSLWIARLKRSFQQIKSDIETEVGADDIKRQLHNEAILKSIEDAKKNVEGAYDDFQHQARDLEYDIDGIINEPSEKDTETDPKDKQAKTDD